MLHTIDHKRRAGGAVCLFLSSSNCQRHTFHPSHVAVLLLPFFSSSPSSLPYFSLFNYFLQCHFAFSSNYLNATLVLQVTMQFANISPTLFHPVSWALALCISNNPPPPPQHIPSMWPSHNHVAIMWESIGIWTFNCTFIAGEQNLKLFNLRLSRFLSFILSCLHVMWGCLQEINSSQWETRVCFVCIFVYMFVCFRGQWSVTTCHMITTDLSHKHLFNRKLIHLKEHCTFFF